MNQIVAVLFTGILLSGCFTERRENIRVNFVEVPVKLNGSCCANLVLDQSDYLSTEDGRNEARFLRAENLFDFLSPNDTSLFAADKTYLINFSYAQNDCPTLCLPAEPIIAINVFHLEEK